MAGQMSARAHLLGASKAMRRHERESGNAPDEKFGTGVGLLRPSPEPELYAWIRCNRRFCIERAFGVVRALQVLQQKCRLTQSYKVCT